MHYNEVMWQQCSPVTHLVYLNAALFHLLPWFLLQWLYKLLLNKTVHLTFEHHVLLSMIMSQSFSFSRMTSCTVYLLSAGWCARFCPSVSSCWGKSSPAGPSSLMVRFPGNPPGLPWWWPAWFIIHSAMATCLVLFHLSSSLFNLWARRSRILHLTILA